MRLFTFSTLAISASAISIYDIMHRFEQYSAGDKLTRDEFFNVIKFLDENGLKGPEKERAMLNLNMLVTQGHNGSYFIAKWLEELLGEKEDNKDRDYLSKSKFLKFCGKLNT